MSYFEVLRKKHGVVFTPKMKEALEDFDPKTEYSNFEDKVQISCNHHKILVGRATNLIHDMAMNGATEKELIRAIKYGLVTVDAMKHGLDYKRAENDFGIRELHKKYRKIR